MSIKSDTRQLYLQVIDKIKQNIDNGTYKENEKLPSEFQLSKLLGVSRATLREALRILEEDNIVTRRHGIGTFVNQHTVFNSGIEELTSVTHMIEESGKKPGVCYLSSEYVQASKEVQEKFAPQKVTTVANIERIRTADGDPVVFCIDKIPKGIVSLEEAFEKDSIFNFIEEQINKRITHAVTQILPVGYNERIYQFLNCNPDQPLLLLKQMHYTEDDDPFLYSANYFRPDRFRFHVLRRRL